MLGHYSDVDAGTVTRFVVEAGQVTVDQLDAERLEAWVDGRDPETGSGVAGSSRHPMPTWCWTGRSTRRSRTASRRCCTRSSRPSTSGWDRLRDQVITTWQRELNARRGAGGRVREGLQRIEVVELQHERSRALDPHLHRHLWLNVKVLGEDGDGRTSIPVSR
jgi:hypothetical protein